MEWIEEEGKTIDEAVDKALARIAKKREDVDIEVVEEGKRVLGILGSRLARVRVYYNAAPSVTARAKAFVSELIKKMEIDGFIESFDRDDMVYLNIVSEKGGLLIGKGGKTLDALQYLVNRCINKESTEKMRVIVDVESYRERHKQRIIKLAESMARQVRETGNTVATLPMNPFDRRTFHMALKDDDAVKTESSGEGFLRRVHVFPRT